MVAYLKLLKTMVWLFLLFSIIMTPIMVIFGLNDGLAEMSNYSKIRFSLGNLGFSTDFCRSTYLGIDRNQSFACTEGKITKLNTFGIIPSSSTVKNFCGKPDSDLSPTLPCNPHLDSESFN